LHGHLRVLHAHIVVSRQIDVSYGVCKKTKFDAKNKTFHMIFFVFLLRPQKSINFSQNIQTHLDCGYVNANKISFF
jgi:hypothetical protein